MHDEARERDVTPRDTPVTAHVGIGPRKTVGFGLTVRLQVSLPGIDPALARTLVGTAYDDICP